MPAVSVRDERSARVGATFSDDEGFARRLDEHDPLRGFRERFEIPVRDGAAPLIYFNGNSLGLMPRRARELVERELDEWARLAVDAHLEADVPWFSYHEVFRDPLARLVGARPGEVVAMNSLTVNLHLLMASFYRPTARRHRILVEDRAFPSDLYAAQSQLRLHGFDPEEGIVVARPRAGEACLRTEDVVGLIEERGDEIALVLMSGVHYLTGQWFDIPTITEAARNMGCAVGWDLAHAAGNVPLRLHDWGVDFAAWCSYKYLNAGPGAVAGCFVHERHAAAGLPRLAGWWGHDPATRFQMHLERRFRPQPGAEGWQVSNPPILSMAPLRASLAIFEEAGIEALRAKSRVLTGYLEWLLRRIPSGLLHILTPADPDSRGCQLSLRVASGPKDLARRLHEAGVACDFREPDVIRVAPVPLYNTFHEVWRFARILGERLAM